MEQLRLGVIGGGAISEKKHLPALAEISEIAVTALSRRNEAKLGALARRFRVPTSVTDYRRILDDPGIDAVLVATGPDTHPQIVIDAAAAGKHVFVEKPIAETSADALKMAAAVERANIVCHVGFNKRFYSGYRQAKRLIAQGALGALSGLSGRFWYQAGRRDPLLHNGLHFLDLAAFFMGPFTEVFARRCVIPADDRGAAGRETFAVNMLDARGGVANLLLSSAGSWDDINEHLDVIGSNQSAMSIHNGRELRVFNQAEPLMGRVYENTLSVHWWSGNDEQGFIPQLRVFAQRVMGKPADDMTPLAATLADGVHSLQMLESIHRSLDHGTSITINDEHDVTFAKETVR
jgi:myo-inositol 2-dehydrogenase/D-chiro-inositol 1-dehydrogenase